MKNFNQKIHDNLDLVANYDKEIKKTRRKIKLLHKTNNVCAIAAIISGISIFVINPLAIIPCGLTIGASYMINKKQQSYDNDISTFTVKRDMKLTENDRLRWEEKQLNKNDDLILENEFQPKEMTVGISHKPLVKTKSL